MLAAFLHLADRTTRQFLVLLDQRRDIHRELVRAPRQAANLACDHSKAPTLRACPRRFNGGIQGQQIGLESNVLNGMHHGADLVGLQAQGIQLTAGLLQALFDSMHRLQGLSHRAFAICMAICAAPDSAWLRSTWAVTSAANFTTPYNCP